MEVEICDSCKYKIAKHRCIVCKGIYCANCTEYVLIGSGEPFTFRTSSVSTVNTVNNDRENLVVICNNCLRNIDGDARKFGQMDMDKKKNAIEEIVLFVIEKMQSIVIAEKL